MYLHVRKRSYIHICAHTSNSTNKDPAPAVDAISVSLGGTPCRKFTVPNGIPTNMHTNMYDHYKKEVHLYICIYARMYIYVHLYVYPSNLLILTCRSVEGWQQTVT